MCLAAPQKLLLNLSATSLLGQSEQPSLSNTFSQVADAFEELRSGENIPYISFFGSHFEETEDFDRVEMTVQTQ